MSRKAVLIRQCDGVGFHNVQLHFKDDFYFTDKKIEAFSFLNEKNIDMLSHYVSSQVYKNAIALDVGHREAVNYILFEESAMGEYQRIKRELEEMFGLVK